MHQFHNRAKKKGSTGKIIKNTAVKVKHKPGNHTLMRSK